MTAQTNSRFRYFRFTDVFEHERGRRLTSQNQVPGDIAYISSSAINNGLDNYISPPEYMTVHGNRLTLSNSGSVGYLFYHNYNFVASDHVMVIWRKDGAELNKRVAMYLKTVFESIRYRYNFGREITDGRLLNEQLYLPVDDNGAPDWQYMENYIKSLEARVTFRPIKTKEWQKQEIDTSGWREFVLNGPDGLFDYQHGSRLTVPDRVPGNLPLITAGQHNQGYAQSISNYEASEYFSPGVTIDMFSNTFYQNFSFAADDNIYVFNKPKNINKYIGLFLVTVINKQRYKYGYGRQFRKLDAELNKILLPVDANGEPDWNYMENYIKSLPYAEYI